MKKIFTYPGILILSMAMLMFCQQAVAKYYFSVRYEDGSNVKGAFDGVDNRSWIELGGPPDGRLGTCGGRQCNPDLYYPGEFTELPFGAFAEGEIIYEIQTNSFYWAFYIDYDYADFYGSNLIQHNDYINPENSYEIRALQAPIVSTTPFSGYWVSGTAASLQLPTQIKLNVAGWGAILNIPKSLSGTGGWLQVPLSMPSMVDGKRSSLFEIMVNYKGNAIIDQVDIWDGDINLGSKKVKWTGSSGFGLITLTNSPKLYYGLNISLHIKNNCASGSTCPAQNMNVISVGGTI